MAKSKQIASSAKPGRSARKGAPVGKKGAQLKPAQQHRRAAKAQPQQKRGGTKQARVIALLEREAGATLDELVAATGWLPHTTRAALTGLRHKGFVLDKSKREDGTTVYRISSGPASQAGKAGRPMMACPEPEVPHAEDHWVDICAQKHAGDLRGDHDSHGCLLP